MEKPGTYAYDGNDGSHWLSGTISAKVAAILTIHTGVDYEYGFLAKVNSYKITADTNTAGQNYAYPTAWKLQGSQDGVTWVDIDSRTETEDTTSFGYAESHWSATFTCPDSTAAYPYIRLYVTAVAQRNAASTATYSANKIALAELRLYGKIVKPQVLVTSSFDFLDGVIPSFGQVGDIPVGGSRTFIAPPDTEYGVSNYVCNAYSLATWDEGSSTWSEPVQYAGKSVELANDGVYRKLTWVWTDSSMVREVHISKDGDGSDGYSRATAYRSFEEAKAQLKTAATVVLYEETYTLSEPIVLDGIHNLTMVCDEEGLTVAPCLMAGGGAGGKSDFFFKVYHPSQVRRAIRQQRNSPSVICWGLGNEFGGTYGGSDEKTINGEASVGAYATALDPTRPWCYYGECEVGVPLNKAGGPCPIRSVHYATAPCSSWGPVPHLGRWLLHDLWGWQGAWDRTKPLVCSEDLYHGLLDACRGMAKWSGDHYCSHDGYYRAWWQTLRWYAQGNTLGGLSGWEPWCTYVQAEKNPLFDLWGTPIPDYLLFVYEFESNLFSGEKFARTFYACNRWFTDIDAALMCELRSGGKVLAKWTEDAKLKAGEFRQYALEREAPKVTKNETMTFKMRLVTSDGRELAKEEHPFFVFPKVGKVAAPAVAQLKGDESDYEDLIEPALGRFTDVGKAIASGAKRIFCDRPLTPAEGEKLSDFVAGGGTVLLVGATPESWSPLRVHKANVRFGWIRNGEVFGDLDERVYHMWGPHDNNPWNWTVSALAMSKPMGADCSVWLDTGTDQGVKDALALRLTVGKGSWILCTLPLAEKAEDEPCALWTLKLLVEQLVREQPKLDRRLFVTPVKGDYAKLIDDFGILVAEKPGRPDEMVLVIDATKGFDAKKVDTFARAGGTVWVMEPQSAADIPSDWPIIAIERKQKSWKPKMGEDFSDYVSFVWRTTNCGLMAGISNESLLWYGQVNGITGLAAYWQHMDLGYYAPPQTDADFALGMRLEPKPGVKNVITYVEPCGLVEFPIGKGRVVVSTLRMRRFKMQQSAGIEAMLRSLANNCGARTLPETLRQAPVWHPVNISRLATSGFCTWTPAGWTRWNKECKRAPNDGGIGWFGNGDDMRHFPVEQTGGATGNEDFPTDPLSLCGAKFKVIDPVGRYVANRSCVMVNPGREVAFEVGGPKSRVGCRRIWVLGAAERGDLEHLENIGSDTDDFTDGMLADDGGAEDEQALKLKVTFSIGQGKSEHSVFAFKSGQHFGGYADAERLRNGGKTAWTGPTQSGKPGALYAFWYDVPEKFRGKPVEKIRFDNKLKTAFMIVAVTVEE